MSAEAATANLAAIFGVARSFSGKKWTLRSGAEDIARAMAREHDISLTLARILAARGVAPGEIGDTLNPAIKRLLPEPYLLRDMERAVARARSAIESGEKIAIFGDYDVDGSSSAAVLGDFLTALGRPPRIYIPDRMTEGYGPSPKAMLQLKDEGANLIVTVDCGAAATAALAAARDAGVDVIVLDHHAIETAPPAYAHVNANQPGDTSGLGHLCAAGVTFLFVAALNRALRDSGWYEANAIAEPDLRDAFDIVGLATVCDVVPLIGVNRAFVRAGLARLDKGARPGLAQLAAVARIAPPFTPYHLGFMFGPRINAGGRVGRCSLGAELLMAKSDEEALPLAQMLDTHNRERQALEAMILEAAMAMAETQTNAPFLFVAEEGWHPGVVGIVAGRLKDRFARPAFVVGFEGGPNDKRMGRGSARSIAGVDIGAAVRAAKEAGVIEAGGGHAMAAGFSLFSQQLNGFRDFLEREFANSGAALAAEGELVLDSVVSPSGANQTLAEEIARAGPYGAGNPEPLILVPDARVIFADVVGKDHIRLRLAGGDGARLDAIAFRAASGPLGEGLLKSRGKPIHAAGRLRADEWNGKKRIQLQLEDAAPAGV